MLPTEAIQTAEEFSRYLSEFWSNFGGYIILISTVSIVLLVFGILLGGKNENKRRLICSLVLIMVGLILTTIFSPLSKELNAILIGAFFTPLIAYLIDFLKAKQKFSNEKDKLSYDYRCTQVEKESDIIGELLGELSTHAAAFKSYGIQEIEMDKWRKCFKSGLVSDIGTLSVARYYYFIPIYNHVVKNINELIQQNDADKLKDCLEIFSEVKKAFLETETSVFLTLIYDLGLLQHNYLARPTVEFPLHMSLLLQTRLEKFKIVKQKEQVESDRIFSDASSERFNKEMVSYLNTCYASIGLKLKEIEKKIDEIKKKRQLS